MQKVTKEYRISHELTSKIIQYMSQKPFVEVFEFINLLQTLPEYKEKKDEGHKELSSTGTSDNC